MELHHQTAPSFNCVFLKCGVILLQALIAESLSTEGVDNSGRII